MMPEAFPDCPFQTVAIDRGGNVLLRDRQTETGVWIAADDMDRRQAADTGATASVEGVLELARLEQAGAPRKARHGRHTRSDPDYGIRRLRPLARRRDRTWRPPGVAMRARKPWVRLRRSTFG